MQLELSTPAQALTVFRTQIQDRMEDFVSAHKRWDSVWGLQNDKGWYAMVIEP
ncbi:MAG TPA: hypothetical protein PLH19_05870 [Anaerolineae bacterium]|nr:hypothetical protein [Anaerolineae bacterium]HQH38047.1 hypothetical protein [Anaerolineae bacterium]